MSEVTTFDWDTGYAFPYGLDERERAQVLGTRDRGYSEFCRQLVFLKGGKIVFQESEPTNIEHPIEDEVIFDTGEQARFVRFGRDTQFRVRQEESEAGRYFVLERVP